MLSIFAAGRPPELSLGIDVDKCMPIGVADDEAGVGLLDGPGRREAAGLVGQSGNAAQLFWYCRNRSWRAVARCAVASGGRVLMAQHSAAAPLSALLRIGGKRKPRSTEASGASRTGNFGEGAGALFPVHLRKTTTRAGLGSGGSQQLGQLGDVGGDAPGLVPRHQSRRRSPTRFFLEVHVGERLPVSVADDAV